MEALSTEVLIIGKSGVGKSSLLNYLFGFAEEKRTGVGRPQNSKGIFRHNYKYDDNFTIGIHDSWGLEPDKQHEWRKMVLEDIKEHDKKEICEWYNTILYCLNANSNIVEEFELDNINSLLEQKNNIVVVFTHCDKSDSSGEYVTKKLRNRLINETNLRDENIICVNSVTESTIGGSCKEQFGKEDIFLAVVRNLWKSLQVKVPHIVKEEVIKKFDELECNMKEYISNGIRIWKTTKMYEEMQETINSEIKKMSEETKELVNERFREAIEYYNQLSQKYACLNLLEDSTIEKVMQKPIIKEAFGEKVDKLITDFQKVVSKLNENWNLFKDEMQKESLRKLALSLKQFFSSSKKTKKELVKIVSECIKDSKENMLKIIEEIKEELQKIEIEQLVEQQYNYKE